jgi:hypothetical protein
VDDDGDNGWTGELLTAGGVINRGGVEEGHKK